MEASCFVPLDGQASWHCDRGKYGSLFNSSVIKVLSVPQHIRQRYGIEIVVYLSGKPFPKRVCCALRVSTATDPCLVFLSTKKQFFLSFNSSDDIPHKNLISLFSEDVATPRSLASPNNLYSLEAIEKLLQVGVRDPLPFGNVG
jgi:hypothetical protein